MDRAGKAGFFTIFHLLAARLCWAETGEFAKQGPQFLLKNGDFRQLAIVIVVIVICLIGIAKVVKDEKDKQ